MARRHRPPTSGSFVHVFDHAVGRETLFLDDTDHRIYLSLLGTFARRLHWEVVAWCLMGNHVHLLVHDRQGNLAEGMRRLKSLYAGTCNRRHRRFGTLFAGRYGTRHVLDEGHLLQAMRYVLLNPVAARLVEHPSLWPWSSYRATMGLDIAPGWLAAGRVLRWLSRDPEAALADFRVFVEEGIGTRPLDLRAASRRESREDATRLREGGEAGSGRRALPLERPPMIHQGSRATRPPPSP